jgi:hypothetical protein
MASIGRVESPCSSAQHRQHFNIQTLSEGSVLVLSEVKLNPSPLCFLTLLFPLATTAKQPSKPWRESVWWLRAPGFLSAPFGCTLGLVRAYCMIPLMLIQFPHLQQQPQLLHQAAFSFAVLGKC